MTDLVMNNSYLPEYNDPYRDSMKEILNQKMKKQVYNRGLPSLGALELPLIYQEILEQNRI